MLYAKLLLLGSELLLARCKPLKMQGLGILSLTQQFFGISTLNISRMATPKSISYTFF